MKYDQKIQKSIEDHKTTETVNLLIKLVNDEKLDLTAYAITDNFQNLIEGVATEKHGDCWASKLGYSNAVNQFIIVTLLEKLKYITKTIKE